MITALNASEITAIATLIVAVLTLFVAIATGIVSFFAYNCAKESKEATELIAKNQVFLGFAQRFWSDEMYEAIDHLWALKRSWKTNPIFSGDTRKPGNNAETKCISLTFTGKPTDKDNECRRRLKGYFFDVYEAYSNEMITQKQLHKLCHVSAFVLFYDVIEPLEKYIFSDYKYYTYQNLMSECSSDYTTMLSQAY